MKFTRFWAAALTLALSATLSVGLATAKDRPLPRQITVIGEAEIQVAPDLATITLGVSEQRDEAAAAMMAVSRSMVAVIDRLRAAGVDPEDLQTRQISVTPLWSQARASSLGKTEPREITSFVASNTLLLRLRDLDQLGVVLDQALRAGANQFQGLQFGVADPGQVQDQIRSAAVKDAQRKALQLTKAAGVSLGLVREITDQGGSGGGMPMGMAMARSTAIPIEAGALTFRHSVTVVFDLNPSRAD